MKMPIYMDCQATTPVDPRVFAAMRPYLQENFGNPSSRQHAYGWRAEAGVERAREETARALNADSEEILFTSGATESNNLAILGLARAGREKGNHIITAATEHRAVLDPCRHLESQGFQVTVLPVDRYGRVSADQVRLATTEDTILISLMAANNEIGTLHPLAEIGQWAKERGVIFHSDAAQALGKVPLDVEALGLDLVSISAHKIYGPKGVGALYVRRRAPRVRLEPLLFGGGHERGLRSGTLNAPGIVGLGCAARLALESFREETERLRAWREDLHRRIAAEIPDAILNGHPTERLCNNLNLSFPGLRSEALMREMPEVAVSAGSACTSAEPRPSHVLKALGLGDDLAQGSLRFGLGRYTTEEEVAQVAASVVAAVRRLRKFSCSHAPRGNTG